MELTTITFPDLYVPVAAAVTLAGGWGATVAGGSGTGPH